MFIVCNQILFLEYEAYKFFGVDVIEYKMLMRLFYFRDIYMLLSNRSASRKEI